MIFKNKFAEVSKYNDDNNNLFIHYCLEEGFDEQSIDIFFQYMEKYFNKIDTINLIFDLSKGSMRFSCKYGGKLNKFFSQFEDKIDENYMICKRSLKPFIKMYTKITKKPVKYIKELSEVEF